jgi:periplasmic copper chaperone A
MEAQMRFGNFNRFHALTIAALLLLVTISASVAADLTVTNAWMRALPASVPSGGYFILHNLGNNPAVLTGASSPACGMLMLHKTSNMNGTSAMSGMARMDDVSEVEVPARGTLSFSPGGYHLMCMNASALLKPGAAIPVTLTFRDGSSLKVSFAVRNAAGK